MKTTRIFSLLASCSLLAALAAPRPAQAGAFSLLEGSTDQNANAYAGQGAKGYDAGAAWANPASMVLIDGTEIDGSFNYIDPSFKFTGTNSDFPGQKAQDTQAIYGALTPSDFAVISLSPTLKLGLAIKSPFGARIAYPADWIGRGQSLNSSLTDIAIEPSLAYAITPQLSIGGGPVIDYISVRETQDVIPALGYQFGDIYGDAHGQDWGVGYNASALYQLDPATRFGLSYRSRIEHHIDIKQSLTALPGLAESPYGPLIAELLASQNTPGKGYAKGTENFNLPDSLDASFYHQIDAEWAVMAEAIWTHWQLFNNITVITPGNGNAPVSNKFAFHNTIFGSAGLNYRPRWMPALLLQGGAGYDEDPTSDSTRQAQIPTGNRVLLAVGFTYDLTHHLSVDAAYNHYFPVGGYSIDATGPSAANALELPPGRLVGSYDDQIDSFSVGFKLKF